MKRMFLFLAVAAASFGLDQNICSAGPARRADIAADPKWVLHLDFDAMRPTAIGQYIMEELEKPKAQNKLLAFQTMFNLDPRKALHGVSLYSPTEDAADGVLIVYADFEADRLTNLARGADEYENVEYRNHTIHSWIDQNRKKKGKENPRVYAAIAGKRIIFGQKHGSVADALDVMDGVSRSLGSEKTISHFGSPEKGKFLQAALGKISPRGEGPNAAVLKLSEEVRLEVGETDRMVNGTITLRAQNEEVAGHLNSIAQGILSLMTLSTNKPAQAKLAQSVDMKLQGSEIVGTLKLPADEVIEKMRSRLSSNKADDQ